LAKLFEFTGKSTTTTKKNNVKTVFVYSKIIQFNATPKSDKNATIEDNQREE